MNKLPTMPIRVKYADKSASGKDLDSAVIADANGKISVKSITAEEIKGGDITGDSIIENMSGYSYTRPTGASTFNIDYAGAVKNGNKLTLVVSLVFIPAATLPAGANLPCGTFYVPAEIATKLIGSKAYGINDVLAFNFLSVPQVESQSYVNGNLVAVKVGQSGNGIELRIYSGGQVVAGTSYKMRAEITLLLSDSLVS